MWSHHRNISDTEITNDACNNVEMTHEQVSTGTWTLVLTRVFWLTSVQFSGQVFEEHVFLAEDLAWNVLYMLVVIDNVRWGQYASMLNSKSITGLVDMMKGNK